MADTDGMTDSQDPKSKWTVSGVVTSLFDTGQCEPEARDWLEEALREDDVALRMYLELVDLDARLQWAFRGGQDAMPASTQKTPISSGQLADVAPGDSALSIASDNSQDPSFRTGHESPARRDSSQKQNKSIWFRYRMQHPRLFFGIAVSIAALLIVSTCVLNWSGNGSLGTLAQTADARWEEPFASLEAGERIGKGHFSLLSGVAEIALYDQTRLIVEAPAQLEVFSVSKASVQSGTVSVFVGPRSHGYTVETPDTVRCRLGHRISSASHRWWHGSPRYRRRGSRQ